jgi:hypothetical protein
VRRISLVLALGGLLTLVGDGAVAGTTTTWTRVTDTKARNIDEVGLARTKDGVLHVVWRGQGAGTEEAVRHAAVQPNGKVGAATTAVGGLRGLSDPDLVLMPDGTLRLFYSVVIPSPGGVRLSSAAAAGTSWSGGAKVSFDVTGGDPGAATDKSGTPIFAWTSGLNTYFKVGTNAGEKDGYLGPGPKCCFYDLETAVDELTGRAFVAYHSNVPDQPGIFVRQVVPSVGAPQLAPGVLTKKQFLQPDHRMPLVARQGGGLYLAYCSGYPRCIHVVLWKVGGRTRTVAKGKDVEDVNLARGPDGRLWVMWQDSGRIAVARTNTAATKVGAIVRVSPPPSTSSLWDVFGEGSLAGLDLLAHVTARGGLATWHRQVLPGLSLTCFPKKTGATCRVTDAGVPVGGATVKLGGASVKTKNSGVASFQLKKGTYPATASKKGYTRGSARVKVP